MKAKISDHVRVMHILDAIKENLIIHEYFGIDDQTIWSIVTINIPQLKEYLSKLDEQ